MQYGHGARYTGWDSYFWLLGHNALDLSELVTLEWGELYLGNVNVWVKNEPRVTSYDADICSTDNDI